MILSGEINTIEGLLRFDENNVEIDDLLLKFTKKMKCI